MKKVVINKCHGGFGLSREALLELARLQSPYIELIEPSKWFGCKGDELAQKIKEDAHRPSGWGALYYEDKIIDEQYSRNYNGKQISRACPLLVKVVSKMKEKAFGDFAKLKIVTIPDDVEFEIDDYDGMEHIAEKHRTWG